MCAYSAYSQLGQYCCIAGASAMLSESQLDDTLYAHTIINAMYKLKLIYNPEPRTQTLKETVTFCAANDLYITHGIDACQCSASELLFDTERDRMFALLVLSSSKSFTPVCVEKDSSFS